MRPSPYSQPIFDAIFAHYIETGTGASVAQIAERTGYSQDRVRITVVRQGFVMEGVEEDYEVRPSYSTDYPGMEVGSHRVKIYSPSCEGMRRKWIDAHPPTGGSPSRE